MSALAKLLRQTRRQRLTLRETGRQRFAAEVLRDDSTVSFAIDHDDRVGNRRLPNRRTSLLMTLVLSMPAAISLFRDCGSGPTDDERCCDDHGLPVFLHSLTFGNC